MTTGDNTGAISAAVTEAFGSGVPLYINGGGSKRHILGRQNDARELAVGEHRGIIDYEPRELVMTARAGTPIGELGAILQQEGQQLAFDPPLYGGQATLGGTLACNLSGPSRPWCGSIRDMVLGVQLISGTGEILNYGGQVMKNVAGYDVSRLQAGALGTLGVISTVSLKVLPLPEATVTLCYDMSCEEALQTMNKRAGAPKPLTGACWVEGVLHLRLAGTKSAVEHTAKLWGGQRMDDGNDFWQQLREMSLPGLLGEAPLWRISCAATAPLEPNNRSSCLDPVVIDWCGAQRWLRGTQAVDTLHQLAAEHGGHACLFAGGDRSSEVRGPVNTVERTLQQRLKNSFDPAGILNPGRMYSWL